MNSQNTDFEWDRDKAEANLRKHGVRFEDAETVFEDFYSITIPDEGNSSDEDRYVTIGMSVIGEMLVVVYTERDDCIRIISARRATPREHRQYEAPSP